MTNGDVTSNIRVEVVTTHEQLQDAFSVRAIAFMEDGLPARQAFDGNDLQSTHFVVYRGREPIGSLRVRWFSDFAKIERIGFRPKFRHPRHIVETSKVVFAHIARKGYRRAITHAEPKYAALWKRLLGFADTGKQPGEFATLEHPYIELERILAIPNNAITSNASVSTLFRIEGKWDDQSPLE